MSTTGPALLLIALGCTPPASTSGTESETGDSTSSSSASTSPTSTDTAATLGDTTLDDTATGTTGDPAPRPEPVVPLDEFTCSGAKWLYVDPTVSHPWNSLLTSDGRLVVSKGHGDPTLFSLLVFDTDGVPMTTLDLGGWYYHGWGGLDAQDGFYITYDDDSSDLHTWLRKFDLDGTLVWEVDRGTDGTQPLRGNVVVAPDGTSLITSEWTPRVERYDAAGGLIYDKQMPDRPFDTVLAMNSAGVAVARRGSSDNALIVLDADANLLWEQSLGTAFAVGADIDEAGNIVAVLSDSPPRLRRFAPDAALLSDITLDAAPLILGNTFDLAVNDAGAAAIAFYATADDHPVGLALAVGADDSVASIQCDAASIINTVDIGETGTVYVTGHVIADDGGHLFAAAFE